MIDGEILDFLRTNFGRVHDRFDRIDQRLDDLTERRRPARARDRSMRSTCLDAIKPHREPGRVDMQAGAGLI
jgi:hypothetical protein